jgi:polar amino acid transport system ATP-binding protein
MSLLEISNVTKRFGDITVLDNVSISVGSGEIIAIIGRSGSGKSTLLRCINGLEPVQAGSITVDGVRVNDPQTDLRKLRQQVGIVFQSYNLFPHYSVSRNITLAPTVVKGMPEEKAREIAIDVLKRVGLEDKIDAYPNQLSGGQQQRVAIARALISRPAVVFADEPTGNLDSTASAGVLEMLRGSVDELGGTVIMVTHDPRVAAYADRVVLLVDGRVESDTRVEDGEQVQRLMQAV